MKTGNCFFLLAGIFFLTSCATSKPRGGTATAAIGSLRLINEYIVPDSMQFKNTIIGGLSGIDYDKANDQYYLICDDPSTKGPARYYTAKITIRENGIDSVRIMDVTAVLNREGKAFPDIRKDRTHSIDLEAMRYDPVRKEMIWSSEGQRIVRGSCELEDPAIVIMDPSGNYKDSFALPANLHIQAVEKGPRHNSVFEGISFDENYNHLYVSVEEPLYEDGLKAGTGDSTAWVRFLKLNRKLKQPVAQYAYEIDAVPYPANPPGAFKLNGISDILYIGNQQLIVIERGYSSGRIPSDVRIYIADIRHAEDISAIPSLKEQPAKMPISKKLLLDMNSLDRYIDNVEGVTFGPVLPNGHRTLVLVTDNNFSKEEKTQFFLFEVLP